MENTLGVTALYASQSRTVGVCLFPLPHRTVPFSSVLRGPFLAVYRFCYWDLYASKTVVDQRLKRASSRVAAAGLLPGCPGAEGCVARCCRRGR